MKNLYYGLMKTWGILGLGWLGQELAHKLPSLGDQYWGTHRSSFDFYTDPFPDKDCDILFLNTPPLVKMEPSIYLAKIKDPKERVIFISSTSVYGDAKGVVDENTEPIPTSTNAIWLLKVEQLLRQRFRDKLSIIRPGGLIGGERHPSRSLSTKSEMADANQVVNLIHRTDLVGIITTKSLPLINAVAPSHPTKEQYYSAWAKKLNVTAPKFIHTPTPGKEVHSIFLNDFSWEVAQLDKI